MIRLFVTDLDGTLFDDKRAIHPRDRMALRQAAADGIAICLATGRLQGEIAMAEEMLGLSCHRICVNGARVVAADGTVLWEAALPLDTARAVLAQLRDMPVFYAAACTDGYSYARVDHSDAECMRQDEKMMIHFRHVDDVSQALGPERSPCKISVFGESSVLTAAEPLLQAQFPHVTTFRSSDDCLDIVAQAVSKGAGIVTLAQHIGVKQEHIACIGDGMNDVPMFRVCQYGFAMRSGAPGARAASRLSARSVAEALAYVYSVQEHDHE